MTDLEADLLLATAEVECLRKEVEYLRKHQPPVRLGDTVRIEESFSGRRTRYAAATVTGIDINEWGTMIECRSGGGLMHTIRMENLMRMQEGA